MKEGVVDVGPELAEGEGKGVDANIEAPLTEGVASRALTLRIVGVREGSGHCRTNHFAGVEDVFAGIIPGYDNVLHCVTAALEKASTAKCVVARVFVRDGGHDEFDEIVFAGLVDEGMPEIAAISSSALVKLRCRIARLVIASEQRRDHH